MCRFPLLQLVQEPYLKVFYTGNDRYTLKRSAYTNHVSTTNSSVKQSQYLIITVDAEEKRKLEEQIKAREAALLLKHHHIIILTKSVILL